MRNQIHTEMWVRTLEGKILGKIIFCDGGGFLIQKGIFFPEDFRAGFSEIHEIKNGQVWLIHRREDLLSHDYEEGAPDLAA